MATAPGRVNLIGEHTDYNGGFVLPVPLDLVARVSWTPWRGPGHRIRSLQQEEVVESSLEDPGLPHWVRYVLGVAAVLEERGVRPPPLDLVVDSAVPMGSGLSSSAALEVAVARALLDAAGSSLAVEDLARACQEAENRHAGAHCGLMDPFVACAGRPGHALLLDCRTLAHRLVPLPASVRLLVAHTGLRHAVAGGEYNRRRAECEAAAGGLGVACLRDASEEEVACLEDPLLRRRAAHVVAENARTLEAAGCLERGDLARLGSLMDASHASLRDLFEVSCPELDLMVETMARSPGVLGARMTGGGFGGCAVALVQATRAEEARTATRDGWRRATGVDPDSWLV